MNNRLTADDGGEWLVDLKGPALDREWDIDPIITHNRV